MTSNDNPSEPDVDLAALMLRELTGQGPWERLLSLPNVYIHVWNNTDDIEREELAETDTVIFHESGQVWAQRTNFMGDPVWEQKTTLVDAVAALRALKPPGEPGAPTVPLRKTRPDHQRP